MKKKNTIKGMDNKELNKLLEEKRTKLFDFRFNIIGGKMKNVKEGRMLRKDIARILTEQNSVKAK